MLEMNLDSFNVRKQKHQDGWRFCGLLVKQEFAQRFVDGPSSSRKTMEVRTQPCKFLKTGDRIVLTATTPRRPLARRLLLGILEFNGCCQYSDAQFSQMSALHRVTETEFKEYKKSRPKPTAFWFGYHFQLVHVFPKPIELNYLKGEVWLWFSPLACSDSEGIAKSSSKRELASCETEADLSQPAKLRRMESPTTSEDAAQRASEATPSEDEGIEEDGCNGPADGNEEGPTLMCMQLLPQEWKAIALGEASAILRPFRSNSLSIWPLVVVDGAEKLVGEIRLEETFEEVTNWKDLEVKSVLDSIYSKAQVQSMKGNKKAFRWTIAEVSVYENPHRVRFLEVAPRFKNRPFAVTLQQLSQSVGGDVPKRLHLGDTAAFFVNQLLDGQRDALLKTVSTLAKTSCKIRVGTTCSGTDICIPAMKEVLKHVNSLQDWGGTSTGQSESICTLYIDHYHTHIYITYCTYIIYLHVYSVEFKT